MSNTQLAVLIGAVLLVGVGVVFVSSAQASTELPPASTANSTAQGQAERVAALGLATSLITQVGGVATSLLNREQSGGTKQGAAGYPGAATQYVSQAGGGIGSKVAGLLS